MKKNNNNNGENGFAQFQLHVSERDIVRVLIQMRCFVRKCCLFVFLSRFFLGRRHKKLFTSTQRSSVREYSH